MRELQRALFSAIITLLNDSERSPNKKWLRPLKKNKTNQPLPPLVGNQSETPSYLQFKLFHFIYPHNEIYIIIPKIDSENTKTHYCFGSHLGFSGDTSIDLNGEHLQAPLRALAFRKKALDNTPSAPIVEHSIICLYNQVFDVSHLGIQMEGLLRIRCLLFLCSKHHTDLKLNRLSLYTG